MVGPYEYEYTIVPDPSESTTPRLSVPPAMLAWSARAAARSVRRASSRSRDVSSVAAVGLGFGAEFLPIYEAHPLARIGAVCQRTESSLHEVGDRFGVDPAKRYTRYEDVLADDSIDFVHINSPIGAHGAMSIAALKAGKHVMCTVPMATTVAECERICQIVRDTGLRYMMAETVVYSREFLYLKQMHDSGELGKVQWLAASHPQDMEGWPSYWEEMIPMHYATHVVSPVLGLVDGRAESVTCVGSGTIDPALAAKSGCSHAVQSCHIQLADSDLAAHIWRFLFDTARQYRESFDVYGTKKSFEWSLIEGEPHVLHTAKKPEHEIPEKVEIPDFAHLLPAEIQKFTQTIEDADHLSFVQGGGHGGSHPHLVHEMLSALDAGREPWPNATQSANWTCVGICANESAARGGEKVRLPEFTLE